MGISTSARSAGGRGTASRVYSWAFLFCSFLVLGLVTSAATCTVPVKKAVRNFPGLFVKLNFLSGLHLQWSVVMDSYSAFHLLSQSREPFGLCTVPYPHDILATLLEEKMHVHAARE